MRSIERQVSRTQTQGGAELDFKLKHQWDPRVSPRKAYAPKAAVSSSSWYAYSGAHSHYGIIGPSRQPYRYKVVGAIWPGGAGPPPFKITHSVYCFFLLKVHATVSALPLVLWPAKQVAEDIEFHHLCKDSKLAVVKCSRFFFHKTNLQGADLKRVSAEPKLSFQAVEGPIWGGQEVLVTLSAPHSIMSVAIRGENGTDATDVWQPGHGHLSHHASCHAPNAYHLLLLLQHHSHWLC